MIKKISKVLASAAEPNCFFGLNPNLDTKFGLSWVKLVLRVKKWVQMGRVDIKKGSTLGSTLNKPKLT